MSSAPPLTYGANGKPIAVNYSGSNYYYALNLQGDVVAILNNSGVAVVQYTYDAWGRHLSISGSMASTLGQYNPFRYRGYIYDSETGLYYLQSRYYNPTIGRFINADGYISTGHSLLGNNMFNYCYNNPVCFSDATGDYPDDYFAQIGQQIGAWLGGVLYDVGVSLHTYITNDSTDEVKDNLEADGFSFYKGVPVLSADWMGTSALSFGIIVMGSGNLGRSDFADTLNHEYGHTRHFAMVGPVDYLFTTAIPSLTFAGLTNKELFPYEYYYDLPWERTADYLGGVEREYLPDTNTYASIFGIYTLLNAKATLY